MFCVSSAGHVPGRPQGGRHGMVFGQIPVSIPGNTTSATTTAAPLGTASSSAPVAPLVPGRVTSAPILFLSECCSVANVLLKFSFISARLIAIKFVFKDIL